MYLMFEAGANYVGCNQWAKGLWASTSLVVVSFANCFNVDLSGGSTSNLSTIMLLEGEQMIRNCTLCLYQTQD